MEALGAAVSQVSATRSPVLAAVDGVQQGAAAVDATDRICVTGQGVAARTTQQSGAAATLRARAALTNLPRLLASYQAALAELSIASRPLEGTARLAVMAVVRDGRAEATSVATFGAVAAQAWTRYDALDADTATWITRAVTPWYRDDGEAAAAYAVLVGGSRAGLEQARQALGTASSAVREPVAAQASTLRRADAALASLRSPS